MLKTFSASFSYGNTGAIRAFASGLPGTKRALLALRPIDGNTLTAESQDSPENAA